ncbi:MAG: polyphosphate kinase 2 family protein [Phycisphaerales bacterium]|jgi:PPK2 family polyphosphate:nucleotide phosphotransferase|nr:polyphosphate kinase 2 family protein [Phycisphaerales bacterium]
MGAASKKLSARVRLSPGEPARLKKRDPGDTLGLDSEDAARVHQAAMIDRLNDLQYRLYAENQRSVLLVLQGMDTSGKDGTIRHVMSGLDPSACHVTSFKAPSAEELDHDFLWRVHKAVPARGQIGVFNRSHYEDVLIARVRKLVPARVWNARYAQINAFEKLLSDNGAVIVKCVLHISRREQKERLLDRLRDPRKNWKFSPRDVEERELWPAYMEAYEDALTRCSTAHAPWHIVPADHKWVRNAVVAELLVETLEAMNLKIPKATFDIGAIKIPD